MRARNIIPNFVVLVATIAFSHTVAAEVWIADQGDGTYKNPVLFADYSDPDVIRVGDDFYLTASSFNCVPGLPILHSRDLVNWQIAGHAIQEMPPEFDQVQHGNGIWAPSIRYHDGHFWIFVGDPDRGIMMTRSKHPAGPWEPLHTVKAGKGLIDPCPLWDDDGKAYLAHAYAKSRAGKNSIIVAQEMAPDGRSTIGEEKIVIDGREGVHPTVEGPKFYKRDGWYYIFAPAGGVEFGWQIVARAKDIFGPYETKRVLEQGSTNINGPHQGAWVELKNGDDWFVHFQELGAYGRLVHLNPMSWKDGWPRMGVDFDGNGIGEPVSTHKKPAVGKQNSAAAPQASDDFSSAEIALQWQWQGNPQDNWVSLTERPGWLRLNAVDPAAENLADVPSQVLQKFPAPTFVATTLVEVPTGPRDLRTGLVIMGQAYAGVFLSQSEGNLRIEQIANKDAWSGNDENVHEVVADIPARTWLRVEVQPGAECIFSFSTDGRNFVPIGEPFIATQGRWIGAKVGLVALGSDAYADFDWFQIQ